VLRDDHDIEPPENVPDNNGNMHPITGREVRRVVDQRSVMAGSEAIDITQAVITLMNNEYKGGKQ